jgi:hypothetical protein
MSGAWHIGYFRAACCFFQLRESENATPIITNSQPALNSPGVPSEARVGTTFRLNVGE